MVTLPVLYANPPSLKDSDPSPFPLFVLCSSESPNTTEAEAGQISALTPSPKHGSTFLHHKHHCYCLYFFWMSLLGPSVLKIVGQTLIHFALSICLRTLPGVSFLFRYGWWWRGYSRERVFKEKIIYTVELSLRHNYNRHKTEFIGPRCSHLFLVF